ncbi:hypothetical protein ACFQ0K_03855 [Nocardioides caeni]|uniref:Lipoprotein n=1 Tax=Nocardioides caeni TaxID=574700 RepID=A0A4S8N094_9ACTN|nr:hypothetical protein [Nocardioides caeni]THV09055.1 hypothetical protein E9934_17885 [Nocardioides caeni]
MRSRVVGLALPLALSVPLAAGLAGCGGDEPEEPSATVSSTVSPSASTTPDDRDSPGESSPPTPSVAPATGQLVELQSLSFHLTEGEWIGSRVGISVAVSQELDDLVDLFNVSAGDIATTTTDFEEVKEVAANGNKQTDPFLEIADDRVIGGVDVWVFTGKDGDHTVYEIGGVHGGHTFTLTFDWPTAWAEGEQRVEEMLASIEWSQG